MNQEKIRKICKKTLAVFLAAMAFFTFVSRVLSSLTVPRVTVGYAQMGTVAYQADGKGVFRAGKEVFFKAPAGFTAVETVKKTGQEVRAGEPIFYLRTEDLEEKKREIGLELAKLELELEKEEAGAVSHQGMTEGELASQALDAARRAMERGNQDLGEIRQECGEKLAKLEEDYNRDLNKTADEILEEIGREYRSAKRAHRTAEQVRDREIKKAEREAEDLRKTLEKLEAAGVEEEKIAEAQKKLERAEEDLELTVEEQETRVREAEDALEDAEEDYDSMKTDGRDADSLKAAYEAVVEAEKEKLKSAQKEADGLAEAVRQAEISLENAGKNDSAAKKNREAGREVLELRLQVIRLDIAEKKRELEDVEAFLEAGGAVCSPVDGVLSRMDLKPGEVTTGEEKLSVSMGALKLEGEIARDLGERIQPGDKFWFHYGRDSREYPATVESVDLGTEEDEVRFTASVEEGVGTLGASAGFTVEFRSGTYPTVIPIEALREDGAGFFCLLAQPRKTVLGEETAAVRFHVTVLEKSSAQAAVSEALGANEQLILSGNKPVEEGERVRVMEQ